MATPLINSLRTNGGTFYTFTSATNDISGTFADDDRKFTFSKFALLDLPDVATPSGSNYENYIVWEAIGSVSTGGGTLVPALHADENLNFAESLQNYALNHEQLVLEGLNNLGREYDTTVMASTSERIFWKWLTQLNAIRFRDATAAESVVASRYVEFDPTSYYRRVVKYIGDIDIVNNVRKSGQAYSECYMHVPTSHGNTPVVLFKTLSDLNYAPGMQWSNGNQYLEGRDSGSVHPSGLDLRAYYDVALPAYTSATTFGDTTTVAGTAQLGSPKPVYMSSMDGAVLEMNPDAYKAIVDDPAVNLISEFNATDAASNFSFNAILVYYDVYRESDPTDRATNLFGVLVLDDYVNQGGGYAYLKRFDKFKPNKVTKLNGNSYGLKFDIKFDTSIDNAGVEVVINEYNTFSLDLYADTMIRLQESADLFRDNLVEMQRVRERLANLEQIYFTQESLRDMGLRLGELEKALNNAKLSFNSSTTFLDLANKVSDNLQSIIDGQTPLNVRINLSGIKDGPVVKFDRSVPQQVTPQLVLQPYAVVTCGNTSGNLSTAFGNGRDHESLTDGNVIGLGAFCSYFKQRNTNSDPQTGIESFTDDLYVNINDTNRWKKGQSLRLVFEGPVDLAGHNIVFWTDAADAFGGGAYERQIAVAYAAQVTGTAPILELVCTDESSYTFDINVLR